MSEQSDALAAPLNVMMWRPTLVGVPALPILTAPLLVRRAHVEEAGALAALLGQAFAAETWDAAGAERELFRDETVRATNAWIYASNHERPVREVLDESDHVFQQMVAAIEGLPDEALSDPARYLPWLEVESIKPSDFFGHFHEEHEADMRAWLERVEKQ